MLFSCISISSSFFRFRDLGVFEMNLNNGRSMSTASSSGAWKSADAVPDQFPAGLRVLVVDDDPTCLMILEKMLRTCLYEGTAALNSVSCILIHFFFDGSKHEAFFSLSLRFSSPSLMDCEFVVEEKYEMNLNLDLDIVSQFKHFEL